jgi:hypothetical protein
LYKFGLNYDFIPSVMLPTNATCFNFENNGYRKCLKNR